MSTIRDLEGNVQKLGGGGELLKATHRLMSAEILGLVDTPVVLVPAEPGVMFIPMMAAGISPEDGGDYEGGSDIAVTWYGEGDWNNNNAPMHLANDLPLQSGMVYITYPGDVATNVYLNSRSDAVGKALALAANYGQPFTAGVSYVDVVLWYTRWEIPA
jgi:hypothetical protein